MIEPCERIKHSYRTRVPFSYRITNQLGVNDRVNSYMSTE